MVSPPEEPTPRPLTVAELTRSIKRLLETQVGRVEVEGEISNWSVSARGHAYFALKDSEALLSCVMFQGARGRLGFSPADGLQVVATGVISVYEARGQYQLVVSALRETGRGDLYRRFIELKAKLEKEGLFDPARKRPLPALPRRIGIVTSPTGAALRDILHVIRRRFPCVEVFVSPTLVQGDEAPAQIVRAIERLARFRTQAPGEPHPAAVDVMIVGRGGGSIEDLWAFNDEAVARAIHACPIPVISAVGHETDFTIADFVADLRAPTPSAAAEIAVAQADVLVEKIMALGNRATRALTQMTATRRLELQRLLRSWGLRQPLDLVRQAIQRLDELATRADSGLQRLLADSTHRLSATVGRLEALNPSGVLARGYSIVSRARDGRVVTREKQAALGEHLRIRLSEGELRAAVIPRGDDFLDGQSLMPDSGEKTT